MSLHATYRDSGDVTVVDLGGRIVLGDGSALLRKTVRELIEDNRMKILINLADVNYIYSSGIEEVVHACSRVKSTGGGVKLVYISETGTELRAVRIRQVA